MSEESFTESDSLDENDDSPVGVCDICSEVLLPAKVDRRARKLDTKGDANRKLCAARLKQLTEDGFIVRRSRPSFRDSLNRGCPVCVKVDELYTEFMDRRGFLYESDGRDDESPTADSLEVVFRAFPQVAAGFEDQQLPRSTRTHLRPPDVADLAWLSFYISGFPTQERTYKLFADDHSKAAQTVTARKPRSRPQDAELAVRRARSLAHHCVSSHVSCSSSAVPELPKRIIELDEGDERCVWIINTSGRHGRYTALSYCWGGTQQVLLSSKNAAEMRDGLQVAKLPLTIRDAVFTTRQLGLKYLWVDALCILQDEDDDMAKEISAMDKVFNNAFITIAAINSASSSEGFLGQPWSKSSIRQSKQPPLQLLYPCTAENTIAPVKAAFCQQYLTNNEPLARRAWALQEAILSQRCLTFTSYQTHWRCQSRSVTLGDHSSTVFWSEEASLRLAELEEPVASSDPHRRKRLHRAWCDVVTDYSGRKLTRESDRQPALAGLARSFQSALNDQYLAGLWKQQMPHALGWTAHLDSWLEPRNPPPATWSWSSRMCRVSWPYEVFVDTDDSCSTTLVSHDIKVSNSSAPLSHIEHGKLKLRGRVKFLDWDGLSHIALDGKSDQTVTVRADWAEKEMRTADGQEVSFYMRSHSKRVNKATRRIALLPVGHYQALLLSETDSRNGCYIRIGISDFSDCSSTLKELTSKWDEQTIEIE